MPPSNLELPPDRLGRRFLWAGLASLLVNLALWQFAAEAIRNHRVAPPPTVTIRRIVLPPTVKPKPRPHKRVVPKIVKPKPRPIVRPQPIVRPKPVIQRRVVRPRPVARPRPVVRPAPPTPAAHHRVITAKGTAPTSHTALPGGNARVGQPIAHQNPGEGHNNVQPPAPQPQPRPEPTPPPAPQPPPKPAPQPPPPPRPQPEPKPQPRPVPPTEATALRQVNPEIPDELKQEEFKSYVRVKVEVGADGSSTPALVTSSGNAEIDRRVLEALRRWRWKAATQDGRPVASTQRFRFDFDIH